MEESLYILTTPSMYNLNFLLIETKLNRFSRFLLKENQVKIVSALDLDHRNTEMKLGCFDDKVLSQRTKILMAQFQNNLLEQAKLSTVQSKPPNQLLFVCNWSGLAHCYLNKSSRIIIILHQVLKYCNFLDWGKIALCVFSSLEDSV